MSDDRESKNAPGRHTAPDFNDGKSRDEGLKKTNDDPRLEPNYKRNTHLTPPGMLGNDCSPLPLTEEQKNAIKVREDRAAKQREREEARDIARKGIGDRGRQSPYFVKKDFDKNSGFDR